MRLAVVKWDRMAAPLITAATVLGTDGIFWPTTAGSNIASFTKVAEAVLAQGAV